MSSQPNRYEIVPDILSTADSAANEVSPRVGLGVRIARTALRAALQEYLTASAHFRSIGAQTPSSQYGGSRSMVYMQMLGSAETVRELQEARTKYKSCHSDRTANHDEFGGILRVVAYRLKDIPVLGDWLEAKVRDDDTVMAEAPFEYPDGCIRYTAAINELGEIES